ncbi:MAG: hypothetical protein LBU73_08605 [Helicobacteraceae bacterium]|jgi:hypothetical protein|nr:hypothetical protein [Helicobacteraceae bacterium]
MSWKKDKLQCECEEGWVWTPKDECDYPWCDRANSFSCHKKTTTIFFTNGIFTQPDDAFRNLKAIESAYANELKNRYPHEYFKFELVYNPTVSLFGDLSEVVHQKAIEKGILTGGIKYNNEFCDEYPNFCIFEKNIEWYLKTVLPQLDQNRSDEMIRLLAETAAQKSKTLELLITTENNITQKYLNALENSERVIIFAYSQGNLFANTAARLATNELSGKYNQEESKKGLKIIHIATPANHVFQTFQYAGQMYINSNVWENGKSWYQTWQNASPYITANDDLVIYWVRMIYSDILPGNIDNNPDGLEDTRDVLNHSFLQAYFAPQLPSRAEIDKQFWSLIETIHFPRLNNPYKDHKGVINAIKRDQK